MKTVMAFGTFDLLHPGHEFFLRQAKKYGDLLIVVIARDSTVKKLKGDLPHQNEKQRLKAVLSLNLADKAVLGDKEIDKHGAIKKYRPDIICVGYDQSYSIDGLEKLFKKIKLKTKIIRLKPFKPNLYKTSIIKNEKNNLNKTFDFFRAVGKLKKTLRYKSSTKMPKESVADHTWRLALMSFMLADELKLKINITKSMEIALVHDLAEAITGDIDALLIYRKLVSPEAKQRGEDAATKQLKAMLPKKSGKKIMKLWREYNDGSSAEARYVYALDKIEALTYLSETGYKTYSNKKHADLIPIYADRAVANFKELKPVLKILKTKLKIEYIKGKFEWKKEYDKI